MKIKSPALRAGILTLIIIVIICIVTVIFMQFDEDSKYEDVFHRMVSIYVIYMIVWVHTRLDTLDDD